MKLFALAFVYPLLIGSAKANALTDTSQKNQSQAKTFVVGVYPYWVRANTRIFGGDATSMFSPLVGYHLNRKNLIEATVSYAKTSESIDIGGGYQTDSKTWIHSLSWKRFWTSTFYSNLGLDYLDEKTIGKQDFSFSTQSLKATGSIGNRWVYDSGLFIGCDWIGHNLNVFKSTATSTQTWPNKGDHWDPKSSHDNRAQYSFSLVAFSLGYSW